MLKLVIQLFFLFAFLNAEELGFKDVKLGMTEKELKDIGGVGCMGSSGNSKQTCFTQKYSTVAGVSVIQPVFAIFYSDTVDYIFLRSDTSNFDRVVSAYKMKYGEPSSKSTKLLQNRMGANFESEEYIWNFDNGNILKIEERAGEIDKMRISFISPNTYEKMDKAKSEATKEAVDDL
jgi:hypothetical protein